MDCIGPKEIAARLGICERSAVRLFERGEIHGFRAGIKPWRTTEVHFESYIVAAIQRERAKHAPPARPSTPGLSVTTQRADRGGFTPGGLRVTGRQIPAKASLLGVIRKRRSA